MPYANDTWPDEKEKQEMSKQSEAREKQEYDPKPVHAMCSNCKYFSSDFLDIDGYLQEKNMRCILGGFAVRKPAVCREHRKNPFLSNKT